MGEYTYLLGLVIMGLVVFAFGMAAAQRERRAHRRDGHDSSAPAR
jgi:hypothetical protein